MLIYSVKDKGFISLNVSDHHKKAEIQFEGDNDRIRKIKQDFEQGFTGMFGHSFTTFTTALDLNHVIATNPDFQDIELIEGESILDSYRQEKNNTNVLY